MVLIIGGAYQGKSEYARNKYGLSDSDIFTCTEDADISFQRRCIDRLEEFTFRCVKNGVEPKDVFAENEPLWADSVIICADISCGVVPIDPEQRMWREATGRLLNYLSSRADEVVRIFCGLEQKLK